MRSKRSAEVAAFTFTIGACASSSTLTEYAAQAFAKPYRQHIYRVHGGWQMTAPLTTFGVTRDNTGALLMEKVSLADVAASRPPGAALSRDGFH